MTIHAFGSQILMTVPITRAKMEQIAPTLSMIILATVLLVTMERIVALVRTMFIFKKMIS